MVRNPDFERSASIELTIEPRRGVTPPPPPDGDGGCDGGVDYVQLAALVAVLVVAGALSFVIVSKRRTEAYEAKMDAEIEAEEKREALERTATAVRELADEREVEREEGVGEEVEEYEEIDVDAPSAGLSMEARVTEEASDGTARLFEGVTGAEAERTKEEREALRLENLKRQYQNAIGHLPNSIPSKELAEWDWVDLAAALATGEKKTVEGDKEVTSIDGRWYHSDHVDTGTFLKEHGAKPRTAEPKEEAEVAIDKAALLATLENRFILGEISEENQDGLVEKYEGD